MDEFNYDSRRPQLKLAERTQPLPTTVTEAPDLSWYKPALRPIAEILADLLKPIPTKYLDTRKQGGANLTYLPWYQCVKLLDRCTGGHWDYSIPQIHSTNSRLIITARITIYAAEGSFSREATGHETMLETYFDKEAGCKQQREWAYGDVASKTESMALRRAAAKFGLALYLYNKD
jgi:hypothetical protein